jgi:hypothetical protein
MGKQIIDIREDELPLTHTFSESVYCREIYMPKGMIIVGHVHNTTHLNIVSKGKALVWMNGEVTEVVAPYTFESKGGVRKVLYILEDMFWSTVHVTNETNIEVLESTLVDKSKSEGIDMIKLMNKAKEDLFLIEGEK